MLCLTRYQLKKNFDIIFQVNTETFKKSHIYETIIKEEIENKSMISWLKTLNLHTYKEAGTSLAEQQLADEKSE